MRLIDADALIERIKYSFCNHERVRIDTVTETFLTEYCSPTIDAKPVRHGRWYRDPTNENHFCCSVCDGANGLWHQFADCTYKFCPWCGAKMDGGAEE